MSSSRAVVYLGHEVSTLSGSVARSRGRRDQDGALPVVQRIEKTVAFCGTGMRRSSFLLVRDRLAVEERLSNPDQDLLGKRSRDRDLSDLPIWFLHPDLQLVLIPDDFG